MAESQTPKQQPTVRMLLCTCLLCFFVGTQVGSVRNTSTQSIVSTTSVPKRNATTIIIDKSLSTKEAKKQKNPSKKSSQQSASVLDFTNERLILSPTPEEKQQFIQVEYPFVPQRILQVCGLDKFQSPQGKQHQLANVPLEHSIAYIKPHKTGSSTITGFFNRIVYGRGAIKMIPKDRTYLGWHTFWNDTEFPGKVVGLDAVMRQAKYDAFTNHAVWTNRSHVGQFMKDPVFATTILREPMSRTISAFNFFPVVHSWKEYFEKFEKIPRIKGWVPAMLRNNLAYALGWYCQPHINHMTDLDTDDTLIEEFIEKVDAEMDLVMMLERMPESLVLLKEEGLTELDVSELVWSNYDGNEVIKKAKTKKYPTEYQTARLKKMLYTDLKIYEHFREKFDQRWEAAVAKKPELEEMRDALKCASEKLKTNYENGHLSEITKKSFFGMTGVQFTEALLKRQTRQYGWKG